MVPVSKVPLFNFCCIKFAFSAQTPITALMARKKLAVSADAQLNSREMCCLLWAVRALPFNLIDDPLFKTQFGSSTLEGNWPSFALQFLFRSVLTALAWLMKWRNWLPKWMTWCFPKLAPVLWLWGLTAGPTHATGLNVCNKFCPTLLPSQKNGQRGHDPQRWSTFSAKCGGFKQFRGAIFSTVKVCEGWTGGEGRNCVCCCRRQRIRGAKCTQQVPEESFYFSWYYPFFRLEQDDSSCFAIRVLVLQLVLRLAMPWPAVHSTVSGVVVRKNPKVSDYFD